MSIKTLMLGAATALALSMPAMAQDTDTTDDPAMDNGAMETPDTNGTMDDAAPMEGDTMEGDVMEDDAMTDDGAMMEGGFSVTGDVTVDGDMLTVGSLTSPQDGFLVIHVMDGDTFGDAIGYAPIMEGENETIQVELSETVESGDTVVAMLHEDTGETGTFEYFDDPETDGPVMDGDMPVMEEVSVQ